MYTFQFYLKKKLRKWALMAASLAISFIAFGQNNEPVSGTTGAPLGGFGAGALKFNANNGSFAIMSRPPADAYDFKQVPGAHFELFTQRGSKVKTQAALVAQQKDGRPDDDAIWPLHIVNFGNTNNVEVSMTGFSPLDKNDIKSMSLPYAFYEFTLKNIENSPVKAAVALQWASPGQSFQNEAGQGISCFSRSVMVAGSDKTVIITTGSVGESAFLSTGKCNNSVQGEGGKVAITVDLQPLETTTVRFVVAWYETADPALAYYFNLANDAAEVAKMGLKNFDRFKDNATNLVTRFRASNLPAWLKNQMLNTLANFSTNSMYKKDGRVGFAEGQWTCFGTMDQMWHARQIVAEFLPFFAWQELRYWARTQMKNGQIHHDFNKMGAHIEKERRSILVDWDDTEHADYRNIQKWVDLNCAFIVSTFEVYQITGDKEQFKFMWPYMKKAGQRILDQVNLYGSKTYPYTFDDSENSYDAGGDPNPFNTNLSAVAYRVMSILAGEQKDDTIVKRYQDAYAQVVKSFADRYLKDDSYTMGKHSESIYAGQWLAFNLKLGEIWPAKNTDDVLSKLDNYYHPYYWGLSYEKGTYDEWTPYLLTHYAGLLLNTNRLPIWEKLQKDAYERQYNDRNKVFDHALNVLAKVKSPQWVATNTSSDKQYISLPAIWRNYYDLAGYHRDMRTKEIWVEPIVLAELNHELKDMLIASPEGYLTVSCTTSGAQDQNKVITLKADQKIEVSTLHLKDDFGKNVSVHINGKTYAFNRTGSGYAKELTVQWNNTIDVQGLKIIVTGDPGDARPALPQPPGAATRSALKENKKRNAYQVIKAASADKSAGVTIAKQHGNAFVTSCNNFDYIQFFNIDFGSEGADQLLVHLSSAQAGSSIEIVLDNVAGELLGTCAVPNTGSFDNWRTLSASIKKITGVHDIVLRFTGASSDNLMNIDKLIFSGKNQTTSDLIDK